jgi:hypothetical protein
VVLLKTKNDCFNNTKVYLNADAKLGINEFFNAIFTLEKFTKTSLEELKKQQAKK